MALNPLRLWVSQESRHLCEIPVIHVYNEIGQSSHFSNCFRYRICLVLSLPQFAALGRMSTPQILPPPKNVQKMYNRAYGFCTHERLFT